MTAPNPETRLSAIKRSAAELATFMDSMTRQLLAASHPHTEQAEVIERLERAFRAEPMIMPRIAALAELAPNSARAGREYGENVREIA